ncbi:MAG: ACP phosphodiesterase [Wenzhouxiangellaceae bacterium]|nr:ACP phosphodiesterase [Wenzhouxiangellaceae bacterium]
MNHLAHLLLAGPDPDHRLGALLGDHVKGRESLMELRPRLVRGVRLHRKIDLWSDRHLAVTRLLAQMQPPWRRYGGIILDVLFDHMLDRHWAVFSNQPINEFAAEVDALLARHRFELPTRLARFSIWAARVGLWRRFSERAMLDDIFQRLQTRHGRPSPLAEGTLLLDRFGPEIEQAFLELFPYLDARARLFLESDPQSLAVD